MNLKDLFSVFNVTSKQTVHFVTCRPGRKTSLEGSERQNNGHILVTIDNPEHIKNKLFCMNKT